MRSPYADLGRRLVGAALLVLCSCGSNEAPSTDPSRASLVERVPPEELCDRLERTLVRHLGSRTSNVQRAAFRLECLAESRFNQAVNPEFYAWEVGCTRSHPAPELMLAKCNQSMAPASLPVLASPPVACKRYSDVAWRERGTPATQTRQLAELEACELVLYWLLRERPEDYGGLIHCFERALDADAIEACAARHHLDEVDPDRLRASIYEPRFVCEHMAHLTKVELGIDANNVELAREIEQCTSEAERQRQADPAGYERLAFCYSVAISRDAMHRCNDPDSPLRTWRRSSARGPEQPTPRR